MPRNVGVELHRPPGTPYRTAHGLACILVLHKIPTAGERPGTIHNTSNLRVEHSPPEWPAKESSDMETLALGTEGTLRCYT